MTPLGSTLEPKAGETPQGFVSRLARLHDLSAQEFCTDMALSFRRVVDGCETTLGAVAELAGCGTDDLTAHALRRTDDVVVLRGQVIDRPTSRRTRLHVCARCLRADVLESRIRPSLAAWIRAEWLIDAIKTCPEHRSSLVPIGDGKELTGLKAHDFAERLAPICEDLGPIASSARRREASDLETYLLARIRNAGPGGSAWLDSLAFHVASKVCEMIGAVRLFGRKPNLRELTEDDRWAAGVAGFAVASAGADGVRAFLGELQASYDYSGPEGPQAVFGRLYQYLSFSAPSPAYDPVRAVVAEHIIETMPTEAGDVVLGRTVERRVVHSLASAAAETGCHPKRLRRLLGEAGLVPPLGISDKRLNFRADAAADFLASVTDNLGMAEAGTYLNAPRVQIKLIADSGLVRPIVERKLGHMRAFARAELDRFLRELLQDAVPDARVGDDVQDLPTAAHRANANVVDIVRWILERRLAWVGRRPDVEGYMAVVVRVDEIKRLAWGADLDGLVLMNVIKVTGLNWRTVNALVERGALPAHQSPHPVKRYPVTVVAHRDVEAFQAEHVTLFRLADELGCHHLRLKADLTRHGVDACFPPAEVHATIYRRRDVDEAARLTALDGRSLGDGRGRTSGRVGARRGQTSGIIVDKPG